MLGPIKKGGFQMVAGAPTAVSVGVGSGQILAANAARQGLVLVNTSGNTISLGLGVPAVLNSGITMAAGSAWNINEFQYWPGAINAIASAGSSNLAIQEFSCL